MTEPDKHGAGGPFGMGRGAWLVLVSLFLSLTTLAFFLLWVSSPENAGKTLLVFCAISGWAAFMTAFFSLFTRVHTAVKFVIMLVAVPAALIYLFVLLVEVLAEGLG